MQEGVSEYRELVKNFTGKQESELTGLLALLTSDVISRSQSARDYSFVSDEKIENLAKQVFGEFLKAARHQNELAASPSAEHPDIWSPEYPEEIR
jgi:hypothetical protein